MEMCLWLYHGRKKRPQMGGGMKNFKTECRHILRKIKKRINEIVTNDEFLLEMLTYEIDSLDAEIKALSKSKYNEIDIIAKLLLMIGYLLGWAYDEGEFFRTPIYHQTAQQRDDSLQKGEYLRIPFEIPYQKRRFILQMRDQGISYKDIAFILKITDAEVKRLERAEHLDELRANFLRTGNIHGI